MNLTKEDWEYAEKELSGIFGRANFIIDGYNVTVSCELEKPRHYVLMLYIDGKFEWQWAMEDCEIRRRFCSRHTKCFLSKKGRKNLKREKKAFREEVKKLTTSEYYPSVLEQF